MKRKVLVIQESLGGGGAERVLAETLRRFNFNKYDITLLLIKTDGTFIKDIPQEIRILILSDMPNCFKRVLWRFLPIRDFIQRKQVRNMLKNDYYDAIISFLEGPSMRLHSYILEKTKINISWVHTNLIVNPWTKKYFKTLKSEINCYQKMDHIVCVSKGVKDSFEKKYGIIGNTCVLYNIIDSQRINALSNEIITDEDIFNDKIFTIISAGRCIIEKRQDRLISLAADLKQRSIRFQILLLGTGPLEKKLKKLAEDYQVEKEVKFLGFKSNPYPYMKKSDLFVLTSDTEGLPTVICEAMCLGKCILSTKITGSDELLSNDRGILTSFDIKEIADKVEELVKSRTLVEHYEQTAKEASARFDSNAVLEKIYSIID